jgi:hypothetical protein
MIFAGIVDVMLPDHLSSSNQKRFLGAIVARDWACYQLRLIADNQQSWLELELYVSRGSSRANDLYCRCAPR